MSTLLALHDSISHLIVVAGANVPDPGNGTAPPGSEKFTDVLGWLKWVTLGIAVAGVMILGAKLTIDNNRGEGGRHLGAGKLGPGRIEQAQAEFTAQQHTALRPQHGDAARPRSQRSGPAVDRSRRHRHRDSA